MSGPLDAHERRLREITERYTRDGVLDVDRIAAALAAAEQRADTLADRAKAEAWDARQAAIGECVVDLSSALGSQETSWSRLVEIAELHAEIVANARASSRPVQPDTERSET